VRKYILVSYLHGNNNDNMANNNNMNNNNMANIMTDCNRKTQGRTKIL